MAGNPLSGFKSAVIFQKIRDAGRPERVSAFGWRRGERNFASPE